MIRWSHIPKRRRAGLVNLAIAAGMAALLWFSIWLWRESPQPGAKQRQITDVTVTWKCANGHTHRARGACGVGSCATCSEQAYITRSYRCPEHGEMEAMLWHAPDGRAGSRIAGISFDGQDPILSPTDISCPQCGTSMQPVRRGLYPADDKEKGG